MKKSLSLLVLTAVLALASTPAKAQVKFGLKAGMNVTNFKFGNSVIEQNNRAGFFVGPTMKLNIPMVNFGGDIAVMYDYRSAKATIDDKQERTVKQQQLVIPINVRYGIGLGEMAELYFFAGPQFGFNIGDKDQGIIADALDWKWDTANFSINVGLGTMLLNHLQLSVNYNIACGDGGEVKYFEGFTKEGKRKGKTNAWQIGLAYYF